MTDEGKKKWAQLPEIERAYKRARPLVQIEESNRHDESSPRGLIVLVGLGV